MPKWRKSINYSIENCPVELDQNDDENLLNHELDEYIRNKIIIYSTITATSDDDDDDHEIIRLLICKQADRVTVWQAIIPALFQVHHHRLTIDSVQAMTREHTMHTMHSQRRSLTKFTPSIRKDTKSDGNSNFLMRK